MRSLIMLDEVLVMVGVPYALVRHWVVGMRV